MINNILTVLTVLLVTGVSFQTLAQENDSASSEIKAGSVAGSTTDAAQVSDSGQDDDAKPSGDAATFARRLELSKEMHKLRPAAEQIDTAIASVASQMPAAQAEAFKANIGNLLNYRAIEQISINAMAETFTLEELEAMVEYNSKPEAASIAQKYGAYQQIVSPEIVRMIDRAIMRMRTGATGQ